MDCAGRPVVLLVEDEPLVRIVTAARLAEGGVVALEAAHAEDALDLLAGHAEVDVLFTDIEMPGAMNGVALSCRVREHYPRMPLIVTSGKSPPPGLPLPAGCVFVGKPYAVEKIAELIADLMAGRGQAGD